MKHRGTVCIGASANAGFLSSVPILGKALSLCVSEQTGIRAEGVFQTEWTMYTHTHTPLEMLGWIKWKKYLPFSTLPLMAADYTKTHVERITMSFIGHQGRPLPSSPTLSSLSS